MRKDLFQCSNLQETGCRAPGEVCAAVVSIPRPRIPRPAICLRPLSPSTDVDLTSGIIAPFRGTPIL